MGADGRRCSETGGLEFDHVEGFARTHLHSVDEIRLACRMHNRLAAEQMYGRAFMDRVRRERKEATTSARPTGAARRTQPVCPGAREQKTLF